MKWYLEVMKKYAAFNGRSTRKEFWTFFLFLCLIYFPLLVLAIGNTPETDINSTTLLKIHKIVPLNDNYTNPQEGNANSDTKSLLIKF